MTSMMRGIAGASSLQSLARSKINAVSPYLIDSFNRQHDYLRISLTEKCNLRCTYCMPSNGVPLLPKEALLTTAEIIRLATLFSQAGISKIRLTGGEPTLRKDLLEIVQHLNQLPLTTIGMTSNGIALKRKLPSLVAAGLNSLNLSLDTLDPFKFELITRRRGWETVMECLTLAQEMEGLKVKLNCVVIKGLNDEEVPAFVELTKDRDITVRFIEYMPFEDNNWSSPKLIPSSTLLSSLQTLHPTLHKIQDADNDTTRAYKVDSTWKGRIGFISSMSDHFCGTCSRLRIGAEGGMKACLFSPPSLSFIPLLRSDPPTTDAVLLDHIERVVKGKKFSHAGLGGAEGIKRDGKMGAMVGIGG